MENIDLTKILENCPKGTKLYSPLFGTVEFEYVNDNENDEYPINVTTDKNNTEGFSKTGLYLTNYLEGECVLFPSKNNRDWSTFEIPIEKFNILELKPFDKVLVRDGDCNDWKCGFFSHYQANATEFNFRCVGSIFKQCVPYNEETKHLIGTYNMPPKKYINW